MGELSEEDTRMVEEALVAWYQMLAWCAEAQPHD